MAASPRPPSWAIGHTEFSGDAPPRLRDALTRAFAWLRKLLTVSPDAGRGADAVRKGRKGISDLRI